MEAIKLSTDEFINHIVNIWPAETIAYFLIHNAADLNFHVNTTNSRNRTALDLLVTKSRKIRDEPRTEEVVKLLLELGADPLWKDYDGVTTLRRVMRQSQDSKLIISFLEKLENIDASLDSLKLNALYLAVDRGNEEVLKYILRRNANINTIVYNGFSPLHEATLAKSTNIPRILLEHGADINIPDEDGETPIFTALNGIDPKPHIELLLEYKADLNARDERGKTPLQALCSTCRNLNLEVLQMLLDAGADPNATDYAGKTALEHLAENEVTYVDVRHSVEAAEMLIKYGANLNIKNAKGNSLLHVAAVICPCTFIRYLIYKGADTNLVNKHNSTFLDILKHRGPCWKKTMQLLLFQEAKGQFKFGDNLLRSIRSDEDFSEHVTAARKELTVLKDGKTGKYSPSRYNLLISNESRGARLFVNEELRSRMSTTDFSDFPIFGPRLKFKYEEAYKRSRAETVVEHFFSEVSNGRLDSYAAASIMQYIPTQSLKCVEKCYVDVLRSRTLNP